MHIEVLPTEMIARKAAGFDPGLRDKWTIVAIVPQSKAVFQLTFRSALGPRALNTAVCLRRAVLIRNAGVKWISSSTSNTVYEDKKGTDTVQVQQTSTHVVAEESVIAQQPRPATPPAQLIRDSMSSGALSIKEFLQRDVQVATFTFTTAQAAGTLLLTVNLPQDMLVTPLADKLSGWQIVRGTIKLRLSIKSSEYQQGLLIASYFPMAPLIGANRVAMARGQASVPQLQTITQLPHMVIDVACVHNATLKCAYINPRLGFDTTLANGGWGQVFFDVYSPLLVAAGTSTSIQCVLFASFDTDVEIMNPTYTPSYGSMSVPGSAGARRYEPQYKLQMKSSGSRSRNPSEAEQTHSMQEGPISKILGGIGHVAGVLTAVPGVGPYAATVSWAANIAKGVSAAFGWSKPTNEGPCQMTVAKVHPYCATVDGESEAYPLGQLSSGKVKIVPGIAQTEMDEEVFNYLLGKYAYCSTFSWGTGDAYGVIKYELQLGLGAVLGNVLGELTYTDVTNGNVFRSAIPVAYFAHFFALWRGGFKIRFRVVKTKFPCGTLCIALFPGAKSGAFTIAQSEYCDRTHWDIQEGNIKEVITPYTSNESYQITTGAYTGSLVIFVENTLVIPNTVANTINVVVEIAAADGFEFAIRNDNNPISIYSTNVAGAPAEDRPLSISTSELRPPSQETPRYPGSLPGVPPWKLQMAQSKGDPCSAPDPVTVGSATSYKPSTLEAEVCISEKILSVRQILKNYGLAYSTVAGITPGLFQVRPWTIGYICGGAGAGTFLTFQPFGPADLFSLISACYLLGRGGVRLKLISRPFSTLSWRAYLSVVGSAAPIASIAAPPAPFQIGCMVGNAIEASAPNGISVQVPQYLPNSMRLNRLGGNTTEPTDSLAPQVWVNYNNYSGVTCTGTDLWRAAADDHELHCFIGCPTFVTYAVVGSVMERQRDRESKT